MTRPLNVAAGSVERSTTPMIASSSTVLQASSRYESLATPIGGNGGAGAGAGAGASASAGADADAGTGLRNRMYPGAGAGAGAGASASSGAVSTSKRKKPIPTYSAASTYQRISRAESSSQGMPSDEPFLGMASAASIFKGMPLVDAFRQPNKRNRGDKVSELTAVLLDEGVDPRTGLRKKT